MFRGREDVLDFVLKNISGSYQDRPILLHGQRRTGKTSVLYQLRDHRLPEDYIPVYIDMQGLAPAIRNDGDLLAEMAYQIGRAAAPAASRSVSWTQRPSRTDQRRHSVAFLMNWKAA